MMLIGLDRDGTLHPDYKYLGREEDWKTGVWLYPDTAPSINILQKLGRVVVCTNQSGVARGYFSKDRADEVNDYIKELLKIQGVEVDGWYAAYEVSVAEANAKGIPSGPLIKDNDYRKPGIGMLEAAAKDLGVELSSCTIWFIGDSVDDVHTGLNAGGKGILVHEGGKLDVVAKVKRLESQHPGRVFICSSLAQAAQIIIEHE